MDLDGRGERVCDPGTGSGKAEGTKGERGIGFDCSEGVPNGEAECKGEWRAGEADGREGVGGREGDGEESEDERSDGEGGGKAVDMARGMECA